MIEKELLRDVRRLEGILNRRLYGLENAKDYSSDVQKWERYLKGFAESATGQKNAERFRFDLGGKTGKSAVNSLTTYRQRLEYAVQSKSRVKDIKQSYRKAKKTFEEKYFGGRRMTWAEYERLVKILDSEDIEYFYEAEAALNALEQKESKLTNESKTGTRKYFDKILSHMENRDNYADIIKAESGANLYEN